MLCTLRRNQAVRTRATTVSRKMLLHVFFLLLIIVLVKTNRPR